MNFKRFLEELEEDKKYYHGSINKLSIGTVLQGRGQGYEHDWGINSWYQILEKHRPASMLAHKDAIFMCDNIDDLDAAGSSTNYIFTMKPLGPVERHDMNWSSEIEALLSEGLEETDEQIIKAAKNYWDGVPHKNESLWEYLTPSAKIVKVEEGY